MVPVNNALVFPNSSHEMDSEDSELELTWSTEDVTTLIHNIENSLPQSDNLVFTKRALSLDWQKIAFKHHSPAECKDIWFKLQSRLRKHRRLSEVLSDAKRIVKKKNLLVSTFMQHDEKPKAPDSVFLLFWKDTIDIVRTEHPDKTSNQHTKIVAEMYHNLDINTKQKYEMLAAKSREEYYINKQNFLQHHQECAMDLKSVKEKQIDKKLDFGSKIFKSPFELYLEIQVKKHSIDLNAIDKKSFLRHYTKSWEIMRAEKKAFWIKWANQQNIKKGKISSNIQNDAKYTSNSKSSILTKKEKKIHKKHTQKLEGNCSNSVFLLFYKKMAENRELYDLDLTTAERNDWISMQWFNMSPTEKDEFRYYAKHCSDQYLEQMEDYMQKLPLHEKFLELQNIPKTVLSRHSKKLEEKTRKKPTTYTEEPECPPSSAKEYYERHYSKKLEKSEWVPWDYLVATDRKKHEKEWIEMKEQYIITYEKFLRNLSSEELREYVLNMYTKQGKDSENETSDSAKSDEENTFGC